MVIDVVSIPGSELLTAALNIVSQSLQIPVIIFLLIFAVFAVFAFGGLLSDYNSRKKLSRDYKEKLVFSLVNANSVDELRSIVNGSEMFESQKEVLLKIINSHSLSDDSREAWALNLIEEEEVEMAKSLEKIDIVTRIGPTLGLMGTLIPMGPGLAALGSGDVSTLASFPDRALVNLSPSCPLELQISRMESFNCVAISGLRHRRRAGGRATAAASWS